LNLTFFFVVFLQDGKPSEEDLKAMGHHAGVATVPDALMRAVGGQEVSFVFTCEVEGKLIEKLPCEPTMYHANRGRWVGPTYKVHI
jgi:hypothetical protein